MKKFYQSLTLSLLLLSPIQAHAVEFLYTGDYATNFGGYLPTRGPISVGGPANNDDYGYASKFNINEPTHMTDLAIDAFIAANDERGSTTFQYKLYGQSAIYAGNTIPDINSLLLTSGPLTFSTTPAQQAYNDILVPFDYVLQPGDYWLAAEGQGKAVVSLSQRYVDPPINSATIVTPEPQTWALFIMGTVLFFGRRFYGKGPQRV